MIELSPTARSYAPQPELEDEPRWMKLAVTAPAPAGCALIRDVRCWGDFDVRACTACIATCSCGGFARCFIEISEALRVQSLRLNSAARPWALQGTPNLSKDVRAIPSAGFRPPWFSPAARADGGGSIPHATWARAQRACRHIVAADGVVSRDQHRDESLHFCGGVVRFLGDS